MKAHRPTPILALLFAVPVLGPVSAALAVVVPGGGPKKTDCYVGFEVEGNSSLAVKRGKVEEKACSWSCTFQVALCTNEPVTPATACTAPTVSDIPRNTESLDRPNLALAHDCGPAKMVTVAQSGKKAKGGGSFLRTDPS